MHDIQEKLLTINPFSRSGKKLVTQRGDPSCLKAVVLHWVANPGTSAMANRNYFESLKNQTMTVSARYASTHFIVGLEGEVIQCLPLNEIGYHVGAHTYTPKAINQLGNNPNSRTLGIELCHPDWSGKLSQKTWDSAVSLTADLLNFFGLDPFEDIWTHHEITGKACPKYFVDNPEELRRFKNDVSQTVRNQE